MPLTRASSGTFCSLQRIISPIGGNGSYNDSKYNAPYTF